MSFTDREREDIRHALFDPNAITVRLPNEHLDDWRIRAIEIMLAPNEIEVDINGCSCTLGPRLAVIPDPACPQHGTPLKPGDGDVALIHPDGSRSLIKEPTE